MSISTAIKLEINLQKPKMEAAPAAVQLRLIPNKKVLTLEEISCKLEKAEAKRQEIISFKRVIPTQIHSRVELTRARKESNERAQIMKIEETHESKQSAAEERRAKRAARRLERVQNHNKKIAAEVSKNFEANNKQSDDLKKALDAKLATAEELRLKMASQTIERVATHNKKVDERKHHDVEKVDDCKIYNKLAAAEIRRMKMATEAIERVANHNKKVADACAETKALQEKVDATKIKCKLEAAEVRREKIAAEVHERLANHNKRVMELKQVTALDLDAKNNSDSKQAAALERRAKLVSENLERVSLHNQKVSNQVRAVSAKKVENGKQMCLQLEAKQQSAHDKRATNLDILREKGASCGLKKLTSQSPQKNTEPDAEVINYLGKM